MTDWVSFRARWLPFSKISPRQWSRLWLCLLYLGFAMFVMRGVLFAPGALGLRNDWRYMPLPGEMAAGLRELLSVWSERGLGDAQLRLGSRLFGVVISVAALLVGVSSESLSKLLPLLAIALAGLTSYILLFSIVRRGPPAFLGSLMYMFSPLLFNFVVSGYGHHLVSYALFPLLVFSFTRVLSGQQRPLPWILTSALLLAFLKDSMQIASLIILLLLVLDAVMHELGPMTQRVWRVVGRAGAVGLLAALMQAQFLIPVLLNFAETQRYVQTVAQASGSFLESPLLIRAFTLSGASTRYFFEAIPPRFVPWWIAGHLLLFAAALSTLLFRAYRRAAVVWVGVALISLFLFKGINPPFGAVNQWLLDHVFLMSAFRNEEYFTILTNLALAVLTAILVASLPGSIRRALPAFRVSLRRLTVGVSSLLVIVVLLRATPYLGGNFHGEVKTYTLHPAYASLVESARRNPRDGRSLLLPPLQPVRYGEFSFAGLDPLERRLSSVMGAEAARPWQRVLAMLLYTGEPFDPSEFLCDGAIHTVLARRDFTSETPRFQWEGFPRVTWTNEQLQRAVDAWKGITKREQLADGQADLYDVTQPCSRVMTAAQAILSTGTLSDLVDLSAYWRARGVTPGPVLYTAQQASGLLDRLPTEAIEHVSFAQNNVLDLTRLFLSGAMDVSFTNLTRDATRGFAALDGWWWKDWHYAAVLDPNAVVAVGEQTGRGTFTVSETGPAELWIKAMQSQAGSSLRVELDGMGVGEVDTQEPVLQGLVWTRLPLGRLTAGRHTVTVTTGDGEHLVARLLVVPEADAQKAEQALARWLFGRDVKLGLTLATRNLAAYPGVFGTGPARSKDQSAPLSLRVPRDGLYTVSAQVTTRPYVPVVSQRTSDYLDTVSKGKRIGQVFELPAGVSLLHALQLKLSARFVASNLPADQLPDAPLIVKVFRLGASNEITDTVAVASLAPEAAPRNDQWVLTDIPINVRLDGQGGKFLAELTSEAPRTGWATATVSDGFADTADHYQGGAMIVDGEEQKRDLLFAVLAQSGSSQDTVLRVDDRALSLSSAETAETWQDLGTIEMLAGSHTVTLPIDSPHLRIAQVVLRSSGNAPTRRLPPILTYRRAQPSRLFTVELVRGRTPFWLIFSDAFHRGWEVNPPSSHHVVVNGFANGWWMTSSGDPYRLGIQYRPQRAANVGVLVSALTMFTSIGWLVWRRRGSWLAWFHRWRGRESTLVLGLAVFCLVVSGILLLAGTPAGAGVAATVGFAGFVAALLLRVMKVDKLPPAVRGALVVILLLALFVWRIASQLDRPAAQQAEQQSVTREPR